MFVHISEILSDDNYLEGLIGVKKDENVSNEEKENYKKCEQQ